MHNRAARFFYFLGAHPSAPPQSQTFPQTPRDRLPRAVRGVRGARPSGDAAPLSFTVYQRPRIKIFFD